MLTSLKNSLLKQVRKLHHSAARTEQGVMLLEGPHLVEAALETQWPLDLVLATPLWAAAHAELWEKLIAYADRSDLVAEALFPELVTTVNPPGILALAPQGTQQWQSCFDRPPQRLVVLDRVQDPGNLGTILRTSAAVGVSGVILSQDSIAPDHPKVLRATSGQWFRQPPCVAEDLTLVLQMAQAKGYRIVGTSSHFGQDLWQADFRGPLLLLFGSEGQGLSPALSALVQSPVRIPQEPGVESLNLAISVAVLLYEARRQQQLG